MISFISLRFHALFGLFRVDGVEINRILIKLATVVVCSSLIEYERGKDQNANVRSALTYGGRQICIHRNEMRHILSASRTICGSRKHS